MKTQICLQGSSEPSLFAQTFVEFDKANDNTEHAKQNFEFEIFSFLFREIRTWHFMQIVLDNLHEMSNPIFWEK